MQLTEQLEIEYAAARESAVYVKRDQPGVLALLGDDAAEFLQGQVTNDIESLTPGQGAYAALLTPKGKMRADMRILRTERGVMVVAERALLPVIRHTIDTFRIGYFFTTEDLSGEFDRITLIGPSAHAALATFADSAPQLGTAENDHVGFEVTDVEVTAVVVGQNQLDLLVPTSVVDAVIDQLEAEMRRADEPLAELVRVESGVPAFGKELDENTIPGEAGLNDRAVSFEKGCYVGQETVARMHYKGKPNRNLRALLAELPMEDGAPVIAKDGRELGSVGTAVVSPEHGPIALAVLRREAEIGDDVTVSGLTARVVDTASLNTN